ncbi:hypothetical protein HK405_006249 [Cladochytrium tenue]|nr:hypothetical protein HK405_006249 [Cladochytrium tenue]
MPPPTTLTLLAQPLQQRRFRAPACSRAALLAAILAAAAVVTPFLAAYASHSLWLRENYFREQPTVTFLRSAMLFLTGQATTDGSAVSLFYSTDADLNVLFDAAVQVVPAIKSAEVDVNKDGRPDYLQFSVSVALPDTYDIHHTEARLLMQTMAFVDTASALPVSALDVDGELRLEQRVLLRAGVDAATYDQPVVNYTAEAVMPALTGAWGTAPLAWSRILQDYQERNFRTRLDHAPVSWTYFRGRGQALEIRGKVRYVEERVGYRPGAAEVLKFGWVQYLSLFLVAAAAARTLFTFCVAAQLVPTHVVVDAAPAPAGLSKGFKAYVY